MSTLRGKCAALLNAHSSNHEIALGLAVGVCVSFFPVYGPQIPACLALVLVFRNLNKVAVLLGVQFSWLYPVVVYLDYRAGRLLIPGDYSSVSLPPLAEIRARGIGFLCARLATMVKELFPMMLAGSVLAGAAAGMLTYLLARWLLGAFRKRPVNVDAG
ncbi:MAG: DUF2062 domain-containing protein [Chlamydiota bacterium]